MPLTFSHPAIVLPLNYLPKRWISLTGLIIGSVAPDFEYFGRMKVSSIYSHTWPGIFWFDLPIALILTFVYHDIVRRPFINNLPRILKSRFDLYNNFNWNKHFIQSFPVIIISIVIGTTSHLFWDSFTHITGYFVIKWNMTVPVNLFGIQIPLYKVIQHTSTLIGGVVILMSLYRMPVQNIANTKKIGLYWLSVLGITLLVIVLRIAFGLNIHQYWNILVTAISGMIVAFVLTSAVFTLKSLDS
ncbi:DUF4184 family protein [Mucilaginibacter sp. HMF5004]|uniref:DUF4184 family protein n=1 Tax=Mucilaginibacter rivuli TaxID=2857527 RepID=UPI001C5EA18E|nr:DUF4184 family protein [Mucilaginibacter rivuli]MBW4891852.1 DUF4184 family protein [Mucilaginibacter rivuli]